MSDAIVQAAQGVTLVGGGEVGPDDLALALARAPVLVAADSGAAVALGAGHMPVAVIGDLDSLDPVDRAMLPAARLFPIREQASTDFDKALRNIVAPLVLAVGFLGGRADHQLAAMNTLVRHAGRPCVLIGAHEVVFHAPPSMALELVAGDVVSLFPMAQVSGRSRGLEWPIDGLDFTPDGVIGTSNRATGPVHLETHAPGLLMLVPRRALDAVIRALASPAVTSRAAPR